MTDLITEELVVLDLKAPDRADAARQLAERFQAAGRVTDLDGFLADVAVIKAEEATGLPGGIGLAQARSEHVTTPSLGLARAPMGVDFGVPDGNATLLLLLATPAGGGLRAPVHPGGADPPAGAPRVPSDRHGRCPTPRRSCRSYKERWHREVRRCHVMHSRRRSARGVHRPNGVAAGPVRRPGLTWCFSGSPYGIRTRAATLRERSGWFGPCCPGSCGSCRRRSWYIDDQDVLASVRPFAGRRLAGVLPPCRHSRASKVVRTAPTAPAFPQRHRLPPSRSSGGPIGRYSGDR